VAVPVVVDAPVATNMAPDSTGRRPKTRSAAAV
jgi:hypothetical protein